MLDILNNSAAKSGLISFKAPFVLRRDFTTNFSVKWMHKDIGLMLESANELQVPLPLKGLTQQMFRAAIAKGYGEEDICTTIKVLEEIAGVEVKDLTISLQISVAFQKFHILILEVSRGGNSHQSETNLIEKTPEATLPGARKGLVFSKGS